MLLKKEDPREISYWLMADGLYPMFWPDLNFFIQWSLFFGPSVQQQPMR